MIHTKIAKELEWFKTGKSLPDFYKCHKDIFTSRNTTNDSEVAL